MNLVKMVMRVRVRVTLSSVAPVKTEKRDSESWDQHIPTPLTGPLPSVPMEQRYSILSVSHMWTRYPHELNRKT